MNEKEKLKRYLELKNISKRSFCLDMGFSDRFLDSGKSLGVDNLRTILKKYPDLSVDWMLFDKEPIISTKQQHIAQYLLERDPQGPANQTYIYQQMKRLTEIRQEALAGKDNREELMQIADDLIAKLANLSEEHDHLVNFIRGEFTSGHI